ncbi:MAG TPA: aldehyde dehydrogenase family protein [Acidimicrobiales bacterium]
MRTSPAAGTVQRLAAQGHLLGDRWVPSSAAGVHRHRYAATGEVQADVGLAGAEDVDAAVGAARAAQPAWAALGAESRRVILRTLAHLLDEHREEAAELAALDNGTPVSVLRPGRYTAGWVRTYADLATDLGDETLEVERGTAMLRRVPYGVVGVIPPWNGSMVGMGQKCGPALAAGNAVVAKAPELAPFGMLRFAELAVEAGLPPGVLNVVVGGAATGHALAAHPGIDKLTFTGGADTARAVMAAAAASLTPLALELGGKSPNIVFADADLDVASTLAARSGTALLSGQGCALPTRTYVHEDVYDEVVERILAVLASLPVGDPLDPHTVVGPVVTEAAMERILGVIARARTDGATLLVGGERLGGDLADGWFVSPTVFGDVDHDSDLARHEVFRPVQAVLRFSTEAEVLAKANDTPYGLAAYVHTADPARLDRMVAGIEAGVVVGNGSGNLSPATPFGGVKQSGFGREGGRAGLEEMVQLKTVLTDS